MLRCCHEDGALILVLEPVFFFFFKKKYLFSYSELCESTPGGTKGHVDLGSPGLQNGEI